MNVLRLISTSVVLVLAGGCEDPPEAVRPSPSGAQMDEVIPSDESEPEVPAPPAPEPEPEPVPARPYDTVAMSCTADAPRQLGTTSQRPLGVRDGRIDARIAGGADGALAVWAIDEHTLHVQPIERTGSPRAESSTLEITSAHRIRHLEPLRGHYLLFTQHFCPDRDDRFCAYGVALDGDGVPQGEIHVDPLQGNGAAMLGRNDDSLAVFRHYTHHDAIMLRFTLGDAGALQREELEGFAGLANDLSRPVGLFVDEEHVRLLTVPADEPRLKMHFHTGRDLLIGPVPTEEQGTVVAAAVVGDELSALIEPSDEGRPLVYRFGANGRPVGRPTRIRRGESLPAPLDTVVATVDTRRGGATLVREALTGDELSRVPLLPGSRERVRSATIAPAPGGYLALLGIEAEEGRRMVAVAVTCEPTGPEAAAPATTAM